MYYLQVILYFRVPFMRFLAILSISLFVLLGKGYAHLCEHTMSSAIERLHEKTKQPDFGNTNSTTVKTTSHKTQKIKLLTLEFEEDDDDSDSFRKFSTLPNQCLICFYAQAPPVSNYFVSDNLPSCAHLSYSASLTYLRHLQLRI